MKEVIRRQLISATSAFGYFSPLIKIKKVKTVITVSIRLKRPTYIRKASIIIVGDRRNKEIQKTLKKLPEISGKILNTNSYLKIKNSLYNSALENGFFNAKFIKSKIVLSQQRKTAEIRIVFSTGPRYRINDTKILDQSLDKKLIKKMLHYRKGDFYNAKKILRSQQSILMSGYYQQAIITPVFNDRKHKKVNIRIKLIPIEKKEYKISLGYGTNTGIRTNAKFANNFINDRGDKFNIKSQLSQISQNIGASYTLPGEKFNQDFYQSSNGFLKISFLRTMSLIF